MALTQDKWFNEIDSFRYTSHTNTINLLDETIAWVRMHPDDVGGWRDPLLNLLIKIMNSHYYLANQTEFIELLKYLFNNKQIDPHVYDDLIMCRACSSQFHLTIKFLFETVDYDMETIFKKWNHRQTFNCGRYNIPYSLVELFITHNIDIQYLLDNNMIDWHGSESMKIAQIMYSNNYVIPINVITQYVYYNDIETMQFILESDLNFDINCDNGVLLKRAILNRILPMIELLMKNGATVIGINFKTEPDEEKLVNFFKSIGTSDDDIIKILMARVRSQRLD